MSQKSESDYGKCFLKGKSQSNRFLHQNILRLTQKQNLFPRKTSLLLDIVHTLVQITKTSTDYYLTGGSLSEMHKLAIIRILFRNPCTPLSHKSVSYEVIHRIFMIANANSKKAYLKIIIQFIHLSSGEWRK